MDVWIIAAACVGSLLLLFAAAVIAWGVEHEQDIHRGGR
jgi:hypothetical protein